MRKKFSIGKRALAFALAFAMSFTAISWGETGSAKAEETTNLLPSGSFDDDTMWNDWTISYDEGQTWDSVIGSTGSSTRVSASNWAEGVRTGAGAWNIQVTTGANLYVGSKKEMETGKTYLLTGYVKAIKDPSTNIWVNGEQVTVDSGWQQFSVEYQTKENANYPSVKMWIPSGAQICLDDFSLSLVEEADEHTVTFSAEDANGQSYTAASQSGYDAVYTIPQNMDVTLAAKLFLNSQQVTALGDQYHIYWWVEGNNDTNTSVGTASESFDTIVKSKNKGEVEIDFSWQTAQWKHLYDGKIKFIVEESDITDPSEDIDHTTEVDAGMTISKISNLPDDFIEGVDVSSYISEKNSGVKYYDFDGNVLDDQGFFNLLHSSGVNYVRLRIWNDPYDRNHRGYGGGNNDVAKAIKMGQWATNAGMKVLIDFHYSDFWTDPGKQYVPKAWAGLSVDEKAAKISEFTTDSLNQLIDAGVDVGMVQVGNETNAFFCGEKEWPKICKLFSAGCDAVHAVAESKGKDILAALHFADPQKGQYASYAKYLNDNQVDYDVFASSYYPFFHGTTENLTNVLSGIAKTYNKKVMVAETSWGTTLEDGDGHDNQIRVGNNDTRHYDFSPYGQATEVRTVMQAVANVGEAGIGAFYWEPAWIPVQYAYDADGKLIPSIVQSNKAKWEAYGSGWAASYGGEYQEDALNWWGGSAMDNQAMFDMTGHPLESLKVFNYVKTGAKATETKITSVSVESTTIEQGTEVVLNQALVAFNDGSADQTVDVTWNQAQIDAAVKKGAGTYEIQGTIQVTVNEKTFSQAVKTRLTILPYNYLSDPSFEKNAGKGWTTTNIEVKKEASNSRTGNYCMKYYLASGGDNAASKEVTLDEGSYDFGAYTMGGDVGDDAKFTLKVQVDDQIYTAEAGKLLGWNNWLNPEIKNVNVKSNSSITISLIGENIAAGGWGAWDDLYIRKAAAASQPGTGGNTSGGSGFAGSTTTEPKADTKTETTTETTKNESGKTVETVITTKKDESGKVVGSTEVSTIADAAKNTTVTVSVEKDENGAVSSATAEVTKSGKQTKAGTKGTIAGSVVRQITEAAGAKDVDITTTVTDSKGNEQYSVTVNAGDLVAGRKLTVVVKDEKTGKMVLVDAKQVKVTANQGVNVTLPKGQNYTLIDSKAAAQVTKEILKTVVPARKNVTLQSGETGVAKLGGQLDLDNVKKIEYTTSKNGVVRVSKSGRVVARKAGTAIVTIKVTLNNGKTKIVKMKYEVK